MCKIDTFVYFASTDVNALNLQLLEQIFSKRNGRYILYSTYGVLCKMKCHSRIQGTLSYNTPTRCFLISQESDNRSYETRFRIFSYGHLSFEDWLGLHESITLLWHQGRAHINLVTSTGIPLGINHITSVTLT